LLVLYDPAGKQYGTLRFKGEEKKPAVVKLAPGGTVKGRLLDGDGRPLSGVTVLRYQEQTAGAIQLQVYQARSVETDADGKFTAEAVPGVKFSFCLNRGKRTADLKERINETVQAGKTVDLGDVRIDL
jgi:hypothetical protein